MMTRKRLFALAGLCAGLAPNVAGAQEAMPAIDVGTAPLRSTSARPAPARVDAPSAGAATLAPTAQTPPPGALSTLPTTVEVTTAREISETRQFDLGSALNRSTPGVSINDVSGNPFNPEVDFRGFVASPVVGTPQGLAVYQNGVRVNEAWGDVVNWDLIPTVAIDRSAIVTGNPLFGLNAIGGAVVLDMKNGFTWQGFDLDGRFGSRGRRQGVMQYGVESHDFASYLAMEAVGDDGYRKFSGSRIHRLYGDVGYRGDQAEIHFSLQLAQNRFGASGPAPVDLINIDPTSVYTTPQTTKNTLALYDLNAVFTPAPNWKVLTDVHYRAFDQAHVDGNTTDFQPCGGTFLCNEEGATTSIPDLFGPLPLGVINRTWTRSRTVGGTVQLENADKILEHPNKFIFGVSFDHGWTHFSASEEIGITNPLNLIVGPTGLIVEEPASDVQSVKLTASNNYLGVYALDSLDVTDALTFTAGARYNFASIGLYDLRGTELNGNSKFARANPMVGATYKITPEVIAYASYSEANRAPTPLELGCADPDRPCLIDSFLVSDPPLKQVVSHTIETGLRGNAAVAQYLPGDIAALLPGRLNWSMGLFRTTNFDDILSVPSGVTGRGYFTNAGATQRQGVEASFRYRDERLSAFINYTLTDATFRSLTMLGSPNNPLAILAGQSSILVTPGAHLTSVAKHRLKAGFDYFVTPEWRVGADVVYASGPWVRGDEINAFGTLSPYATVNLRSSYRIGKNMEVYGLIENVGNARPRSFGTFFNTTQIPFLAFNNPRLIAIGAPIGFYGGVKIMF
jgi:iron complex outermembrane receptor protein